MFENSNNANPSSTQAVDDIFADTDTSQDNKVPGSSNQVMTRRVGLGASSGPAMSANSSSDSGEGEEKSGGKGFTIAVVIMGLVIVGLIGFLVYNKFFNNVNNEIGSITLEPVALESATETATTTNSNATNTDSNTSTGSAFIDVLPTEASEDNDVDEDDNIAVAPLDSDNDGISDAEERILGTNPFNSDTDDDGLSDYEEIMTYKTNPLLVDTDGDGLTDYEEIMIYKTNPLVADTDGDGYTDGAEVASGYDPLSPSGSLLPENLRDYKPLLLKN